MMDRCSFVANFYPRPPRGGRRQSHVFWILHYSISIHALREEGDFQVYAIKDELADFYPRPPRGGRLKVSLFDVQPNIDFYPRPPRGGRRRTSAAASKTTPFLSTPSARRATKSLFTDIKNKDDFYPRPPRGGRPLQLRGQAEGFSDFYPRPPRGGRRAGAVSQAQAAGISIHALREEGDLRRWPPCGWSRYFYPRPPRGGRPRGVRPASKGSDFYPRPPRGGRLGGAPCPSSTASFLSTPSARRATSKYRPVQWDRR